tara:strand:- start:13 stop:369 length:357 start_codon:yes stop_codon:yes gene_type:complete
MAIFSSHILNSMNGKHAANVKFSIFKINLQGNRDLFFESSTDEGGRIVREIDLSKDDCSSTFEMIVHLGDYFNTNSKEFVKDRIVSEIVVRFNMESPTKKYHIPIIISPNGYSIWWSE